MAGIKLDRKYVIRFEEVLSQKTITSILDMMRNYGYIYSYTSHYITDSKRDEIVIYTCVAGKRKIKYLLEEELGRLSNFTIEEIK